MRLDVLFFQVHGCMYCKGKYTLPVGTYTIYSRYIPLEHTVSNI